MRLTALRITWFRGAAETVTLDLGRKSMVVYGTNGAGKSSFVDGVEYVLGEGKIRHQTHEYSGRNQEKGIPNTHTPAGQQSSVEMSFQDGTTHLVRVKPTGAFEVVTSSTSGLAGWNLGRSVLRQDEVASFIADTKGGKYSALLPLLGLHSLEVAAENIRKLPKAIEDRTDLKASKLLLAPMAAKRKQIFADKDLAAITADVVTLHRTYCRGEAPADPLELCAQLSAAIAKRIEQSSAEQREHAALQAVGNTELAESVKTVRSANSAMAEAADPLVQKRLAVLTAASDFVAGCTDQEVECPACGQEVTLDDFQAHVDSEQHRLEEVLSAHQTRSGAMAQLSDQIKALQAQLKRDDLKPWVATGLEGKLAPHLIFAQTLDAEALRATCTEEMLQQIETHLIPLIETAATDAAQAPPALKQLTTDQSIASAAEAAFKAVPIANLISRATELIAFANRLEAEIRSEIRSRSIAAIEDISADIREMWGILHPTQRIDGVKLYVPHDTDKAIDIGLTFHGVAQESPRLTLSEGYRNSLGLCIFLAMAKRDNSTDCPLVLDDVVVSLDRNHRGMIVELLQKFFAKRQILLLTHDRDWYGDLRQQLDSKEWLFQGLMPFDSPSVGIQLAAKSKAFSDARARIKLAPDGAANDARKIMDAELSRIAEGLQVRLQYFRGDRNDKRTAYDFLERIIADGRKCLQRRNGKEYQLDEAAIGKLDAAKKLLLTWANRGSHGTDVAPDEATKLIDACEAALAVFRCETCGKPIAHSESNNEVQCQCGAIRWRFAKG